MDKSQRYLVLAIVAGIVVLAGIWAAFFVNLHTPQVREDANSREVIITEITLAGLRTPSEESQTNPALKQQRNYQAGEPLALRVTTAENITNPIQVSVRLLDKGGGIQELSPSSLEFQPGTSTFCCWHIPKDGDYTLQIFRPEKTVTSIPLKIRK